MKIKSVKKVISTSPIHVYDIYNATPNHNFLVRVDDNSASESDDGLREVVHDSNKYIVSHNCGFLDEVDFTSGSSPIEGLSKMMALYLTIKRRIESRYMKMGTIPGMMFLVSSKRSVNDFLESYIRANKDTDEILISDEPIWKVKNTPGVYSGETFKVAVGTRVLPSKILDQASNEEIESIDSNGLRVIDVPVEHRKAFELDINSALRDIAGIALSSDIKYIDMEKYQLAIRDYMSNPFISNIIQLDFDDDSELVDYLVESRLNKLNRSKPHAIHWDTSKTGDNTGLAMVELDTSVKIDRLVGGETYSDYDRVYKTVFAIGIKPTHGKEIPYYKIREFIYYLKNELNYNIVSISADSFNSVDTLQQFKLKGMNAQTISVDRTIVPYTTMRNALNEGRLLLPQIDELELEFADIYYDSVKDKVDHTVTGSKDILDSVTGCVYALSSYKISGSDISSAHDFIEVNKEDTFDIFNDNWILGNDKKYYD